MLQKVQPKAGCSPEKGCGMGGKWNGKAHTKVCYTLKYAYKRINIQKNA